MRKSARKPVILAVGVALIMAAAGCQEEQKIPNDKKSRFVAAENIELRKQLQQREKEIENQKQLLAQCEQDKKLLQEKSTKYAEDLIRIALTTIGTQTKKLRQDNESLKMQIEKLKAELDEARKQAGP